MRDKGNENVKCEHLMCGKGMEKIRVKLGFGLACGVKL